MPKPPPHQPNLGDSLRSQTSIEKGRRKKKSNILLVYRLLCVSLNFLVLITYSISFRFCQSKGWKLFLSLLLLFWLYMANCRHKHFTPLINLNYTLFCFGIHHKNPLYKSHLRKSQLYFQDTSFFSCKLLYQYQHWRLHMQKNVYICLTTLACKKKCIYTC